MGRQPSALPDAGAARNPNQSTDTQYLSSKEASVYLWEAHKIEISEGSLTLRRSFGKAPAFVRIGNLVRYHKNDLDMFARAVGLNTKGFDQPKREVMTDRERTQRRAGK